MHRAVLIACLSMIAIPARAEERRIMVTSFDSIRVEGPFDVRVRSGGSPAVVASGEPRALDGIDIRLEDRVLVVRGNPSGWGGWPDARTRPAVVNVTTPRLSTIMLEGAGKLAVDGMKSTEVSVALTGSGRIEVGGIEADRLSATLAGSGEIKLGGAAHTARVINTGVGSVVASDLSVRDLTVQSQSAGDSSFTATQTANVVATGTGGIEVSGAAACAVTGTAQVRCSN